MHIHVHTMAPMWRSEDNLWRWLSPSMWVGPGAFYPVSHLMGPGLEPLIVFPFGLLTLPRPSPGMTVVVPGS